MSFIDSYFHFASSFFPFCFSTLDEKVEHIVGYIVLEETGELRMLYPAYVVTWVRRKCLTKKTSIKLHKEVRNAFFSQKVGYLQRDYVISKSMF